MSAANADTTMETSTIEPATITRLASTNGGKCWLCDLHGKHATQVATANDLPLINQLQRRGVSQPLDLNAFENLVFLCTACHVAFTEPDMVWVFLPSEMEKLSAAEKAVQLHRQASATSGQPLQRPPPATASDMLFSRYQLRSGFLFTHIFTNNPTRAWPGSPLAAIVRGARMMAWQERLPVEDGGVPANIALKLQRLLVLFGTPEPRLVVRPQDRPEAVGIRNTKQSQAVVHTPRVAEQTHQATGPQPGRTLDSRNNIAGPISGNTHDLGSLGRGFSSTLKYVQDHSADHNLIQLAHNWLAGEIRSVIVRLRKELRSLDEKKDNPLLLPKYAINSDIPFEFNSSYIPFILVKYNMQFAKCLLSLFKACGLNATCAPWNLDGGLLQNKIMFTPSDVGIEGQVIYGRLFDLEFEEEFVRAAQALTLELQ